MLRTRNARVAMATAIAAAGMLGMAFAAVPLYQLFCQVTGYGGTIRKAEKAATVTLDRKMTIWFDANTASGLDWEFRPVVSRMDVRIGETHLAYYRATNKSDRPVVGSATFNVTPDVAGSFFNKLACFCFTEQTLQPGQSIDMPVSFFVDPAIVKDMSAKGVKEITLSYTFYPVKKPAPKPPAKGS